MKKITKIITIAGFAFLAFSFMCCKTNVSEDEKAENEQTEGQAENEQNSGEDSKTSTGNQTSDEKPQMQNSISQYFWGEWQRMDNGTAYVIDETGVTVGTPLQKYKAISSTEESLTVSTLGTFTKQSDSVMVNGAIPYFRKGGTNLEYTMKLVGFEDSVSRAARAASSTSLGGYKVTGKSDQYETFTSKSESNTDGTVTLTAPTAGDVQTVTVSDGDSTLVVVPGIKVENNGSNMGTIPISEAGQYSLKVTGTIPDEEKDDGYLFGNSYKEYPMTLTITNVSEVTSASSVITITSASTELSVTSFEDANIEAIIVSTLKPSVSKTINLSVKYGSLSKPYVDTGLNVTVENLKTGKKWMDFVPLRFYRALVPISISALSTEHNSDAALNGFIIYPDGNSQFFSVPDMGSKILLVPSFGSDKRYMLSFSGATVSGTLSSSTEMFYTVSPGTRDVQDVVIPTDVGTIREYYRFGEENDSEKSPYVVTNSFEAYLGDGDIDFFSVMADSDEVILPSGQDVYTVRYLSDYGTVPETKTIVEGYNEDIDFLPTMEYPYYNFDGWYIGSFKVDENYCPTSNVVTLIAKWTPIEYSITYELNGGTNSSENPENYTIESEEITLGKPIRTYYTFAGWYETSDFAGSAVTKIAKGSHGNRAFYAKWIPTIYTISYELNGGTLASDVSTTYTVETQSFALPIPTRNNYDFVGWYQSSDFSGKAITSLPTTLAQNITLYAKWTPTVYAITYELNGGTNASANPKSYTVESEMIMFSEPMRKGYTFGGWYENKDFEGSVLTAIKSGSTGNRTFYAKWTAITYSITYNLNSGTNSNANPSSYTTEIEISLKIPARTGYKFGGWYTNSSFSGSAVTQITTGSTGDKNLYAKWIPISYTITYNLNGGTNSSANPNSYTIENKTITLSKPTRQGYKFGGWYESADFASSEVTTIPTKSTGSRTFYAKWEIITYSITYKLNGGTFQKSVQENYTVETATFSLPSPIREGYSFEGWYKTSTFSDSRVYSVMKGSIENKIFYAKWVATSYTIGYELNGGINSNKNPNNYTVESGTIILAEPVRTGYLFGGWYTNSSFTGSSSSQIAVGSIGNKKFYAKWNAISYSITYNLNSGSNSKENPLTYTIESDSIVLKSPKKDGYEFGGWFDNSSYYGNPVSSVEKGSYGDITLFARWFIGVKFNASLDDIESLDLTNYSEPFELYIFGSITDDILKSIAKKLESATVSATLNLKDAKGITNYSLSATSNSIFTPCKNLKNIILPDCLTGIGDYAFCNCPQLETISIPDSVTKIGSYAFSGCTNIKELYLPKLWEFGPHAFDSCLNKVVYDDTYSTWKVAYTSYDSPVYIYVSLFKGYEEYKNMWWKH